jgi:hypothetical protein
MVIVVCVDVVRCTAEHRVILYESLESFGENFFVIFPGKIGPSTIGIHELVKKVRFTELFYIKECK